MFHRLKKIDSFAKNTVLVFAGTSLANFLNLIYQLLIAHKLAPADFAAFNALLSIFMVIASPLNTIQMAVVKYSAEFNAHQQLNKIKLLLSGLLKKSLIFAVFGLAAFWFISAYVMDALKIPSVSCGYILALLLALAWFTPSFLGGVQGLEFFGWMASSSALSAMLKLILAFIFISLGYGISGALGALLISNMIIIIVCYIPLRRFISLRRITEEDINYKEMLLYLFPLGLSYFFLMNLVTSDMVLVKYFFSKDEAGLYSLAQMLGKIFLFLPGAISIVMFPRTSGLKARNMDTVSTLNRSLRYVSGLAVLAVLSYNLFPAFILKLLTGKVYPESILLGRLFSISMTFFSLLYVMVSYFLSINDLRFLKYLILFTFFQVSAIGLFHKNLIQVQIILCINAFLLFTINFILAYKKRLKDN